MTASNQMIKIDGEPNNLVMIQPRTFAELDRYCTLIAKSSFCPKAFNNKPGDVMVALQMGAEVGLSPMQAIQNIAVINGRPCLWGDGALAVVMASPNYVSHKEWMEGNEKDGTLAAHCLIKRRGSEDYTYIFSMADAKKANLWGKQGPWTQYPSRMLQNRARGFAIRDKFADALRGINIREEVEDYVSIKDVTPNEAMHKQAADHAQTVNQQLQTPDSQVPLDTMNDKDFMDFMKSTIESPSLEDLRSVFDAYKHLKAKPEHVKALINARDNRKNELLVGESVIQPEEVERDQANCAGSATESGEI